MCYPDYLTVGLMMSLDLFDNIPYKYIKDIINNDKDHHEDEIDVEIEDLDCDRVAWCKTRFTFELNIDVSGGISPFMMYKKFVVEKEYNASSPYALMLLEFVEEQEEVREEVWEEEEEEEESYLTSVIDLKLK